LEKAFEPNINELEGCTLFGETFEEVKKNIAEAVEIRNTRKNEKTQYLRYH